MHSASSWMRLPVLVTFSICRQVDDSCVWLGDVCVRLTGRGDANGDGDANRSGRGITGWAVEGLPAGESVHGIPNHTALHSSSQSGAPRHHRNSVRKIDHIVISSPDLARTEADMRAKLGLAPLRTRKVPKTGMVQVFYRLGTVVLEVVGEGGGRASPGKCSFWGLALRVDNIDQTKVRPQIVAPVLSRPNTLEGS